MNCIHILISGKVQGVFFRDNTRRKSIELGLNGYVKNLPDGTVEVVAQGDGQKLEELIEFIKKSPGTSKVKNLKVTHKEPEKFKGFEIRH